MARAAATVARPAPARAPARRAPAKRAPTKRAPSKRASTRRAPARRPVVVPTGTRLLDGLLHGRAWIALVGLLLVGIVFFNVDLLRVNRQIAATSERTTAAKRQNSRLRLELARLSSSERIQSSASARGLALPAPGQVHFLRASPIADARRAAERLGRQDSAAAQSQPAVPAQAERAEPAQAQQAASTQPQQAVPAQPQAASPGSTGATP